MVIFRHPGGAARGSTDTTGTSATGRKRAASRRICRASLEPDDRTRAAVSRRCDLAPDPLFRRRSTAEQHKRRRDLGTGS